MRKRMPKAGHALRKAKTSQIGSRRSPAMRARHTTPMILANRGIGFAFPRRYLDRKAETAQRLRHGREGEWETARWQDSA